MINYLKITFGILIVLSASRFIPHPPNFTALIALSFYIPALLGKKYIPSLSNNVFNDVRANVIIEDGVKFVKETNDIYDLVIIDSTDPFGPGETLFTFSFYENLSKKLSKTGLVILQGGVPFLQEKQFKKMNDNLKQVFCFYGFYFVTVPTYSGGILALGWASNKFKLDTQSIKEIEMNYKKLLLDLKYSNVSMHSAAFAIPEAFKKLII